jgi:hypothetical protein
MKTCLIDAACRARKTGSESRFPDVVDIGTKGGFSKVCRYFRANGAGRQAGPCVWLRSCRPEQFRQPVTLRGGGASAFPFDRMDACPASHYIGVASVALNPKFADCAARRLIGFSDWPHQCRDFRSSHDFDIGLAANFEIKTTLEINRWLVSFDTEIRIALDIELRRISESGHRRRTSWTVNPRLSYPRRRSRAHRRLLPWR